MATPPTTTFEAATKIDRLDSHTYAGEFSQTFCIGAVPNGGYVATHFLAVARQHLSARDQPDTLTAHWEFLSRSAVGRAVFVVEDVKLGRQTSVLLLKLYQGDSILLDGAPWVDAEKEKAAKAKGRTVIIATAYVTQTNFAREEGITLDTGYQLWPSVPPVDFARLKLGKDEAWTEWAPPNSAFKKIRNTKNCEYFVPRRGQVRDSVVDMWLHLPQGERFTPDRLAFVVDAWPTVVEAFRPSPPAPGKVPTDENTKPFSYAQVFWYPTVVLNLEVKKRLPTDGEEWLFTRLVAKQIRNGRLDLEVLVYDKEGDLVAISSHVNLVLGAERNLAGRGKSSL